MCDKIKFFMTETSKELYQTHCHGCIDFAHSVMKLKVPWSFLCNVQVMAAMWRGIEVDVTSSRGHWW